MKILYTILILTYSLKIQAQLDTCTQVSDTLTHIYSCMLNNDSLCPSVNIHIDSNLINYANGLTTYLVLHDATNPNNCATETQLGVINFGDTIPITLAKYDFSFYMGNCTSNFFTASVIAIGKPTTIGQSYYCKSEISVTSLVWSHPCAILECENNAYVYGNKNCTITNCITTVDEHSNIHARKLLKIVDVLGRSIKPKKNTPLFYIYNDGTVEKKIIIE